MADYATPEQIKLFAREADGLDSIDGWEVLATAASRAIDGVCEVEDGFFAAASDEGSDKSFYGNGSSFLKVAPYRKGSLDAESSKLNDDDPFFESYDERGEQGLQYIVTDGAEIPEGLKVTVNAEWGFDETPAEVTFATIQLALLMWRQSDVSFAGIANADNNLILRELPPVVKSITDRLRAKYSPRGIFA